MATDVFFSQPVSQNPTSGIYNDKTGPPGSANLTKIKAQSDPNKTDSETFLSTLRKVSQNRNRMERFPRINSTKCSKPQAAVPEDKTDEFSEPTAAKNEKMPLLAMPQQNTKPAESDHMPVIRNFMDFIRALEEMGFHLSEGGLEWQGRVDAEPSEGKNLAALKLLMARLQQNEPASSAELKAAFQQLQQFIAVALEVNPSLTPVDETAGNGQSVDLGQDSARLFERMKQLFADAPHQMNDTETGKGEGSPGAKPFESIFGPPVQSAEDAGGISQGESRGAGQPEKGAPEKLQSSSQVNENPKEAAAVEKTDADPSRSKEETAFWRITKTAERVETAGQIPAAQGRGKPNNTETILDNQPVKQTVPAGLKMGSGSPSNGLSQAAAGEEPAARMSQEIPSLKDGNVKVFSGMKEETVGKVIKTEVGSNDSGLLTSQNQPMEKAAQSTTLPKEAESDRSGLKTQTLDQIVQRAVIHLKNGQHEARIDLKPEYLGHIRMQVISENNQVTVKILAEHGFVKDMIENNGHQLKADLQQQGLHIDKLEVSVLRDLDDSGNPKERLTGMRTRQGVADNGKQGQSGQDLPRHKRQPRRTISGEATVDYFA